MGDESSGIDGAACKAGLIVLGMHLHCQGCVDDVVNCLRGFEGVEQIETDADGHTVTVKGENADPKRVWDRVKKKMGPGKHVTLISPILKQTTVEIMEDKKEEEPKVVEVVIKVNLHCEGCARDVKYTIHRMEGVYTVEADTSGGQVTVKGVFEAEELMEYVRKKTGKHVCIVKQTFLLDDKPDQEENGICNDQTDHKVKEEEDKENICIIEYHHHFYPCHLVHAPLLFSDENPNACSLM